MPQKVQAILLGKIGTASEEENWFHIEGDSALHPTTNNHYYDSETIIDNAFEWVSTTKRKKKCGPCFAYGLLGTIIVFEVIEGG